MLQQLHKADLFTSDLYQFTCSYAYFMSNKHQQQATFEVFFRKYPFDGKYVVLGGLRAVKQFLDNLAITQEQIQYLKTIFPHMKNQYFEWLKENVKKPIKIKTPKEGQIVFSKEPLLTYTGQIAIVQLLQTPILNLVGFASLVATNASRMVKVVEPKKCIQFGIRRAQGPDGALTASEFAYLGGFEGTSNIHAAQKLKIACYGTMSHAYVTSFEGFEQLQQFELNNILIVKRVKQIKEHYKFDTHSGELAAFTNFAKAFPNNYITLIDTYSTIHSGLLNTIIVAKALVEAGISKFGVRLDSGDLTTQSKKCRQIWNKHFPDGPRLNILASDDLHQERLKQMQSNHSEIDVYAIGTNIATCKKQPALGLVCKLVELDGVPKLKLSEDVEKATLPANKSIFRVWTTNNEQSCFDLIALEGQKPEATITVADPAHKYSNFEVTIQKIQLLNQYWNIEAPFDTLQKCRQHFNNRKKTVQPVLCLKKPKQHKVLVTQKFLQVLNKTLQKNKKSIEEVNK